MRTRVKICGITRRQDAQEAVRLGADAIGFVFFGASGRAIDPRDAVEVASALPPFVSVVALFLSPTRAEVEAVLSVLRPDHLQFHGEESPAFCESFGLPFVKAVAMGDGGDPLAEARRFGAARALLLDSNRSGAMGGSGRVFDWSALDDAVGKPIILAGGLSPDNVESAIRRVQPYGVDVSSGLETAPGVKDAARMQAFFRGVRRVDSER